MYNDSTHTHTRWLARARGKVSLKTFPISIIKYGLFHQNLWGGAKVLGKLLVPGRPTNLDTSRARAYCASSRCGRAMFDIFSLFYLFFFLSPSLGDGPI